MKNARSKMDALLYRTRSRIPEFKLQAKNGSFFMWLIYIVSFMFLWNRRFMTGYITTIGTTVYVPGSVKNFGAAHGDVVVLKHEIQHMLDSLEHGVVLWSLKYLFPQVLAPLCLLGLAWWPLWFIALALLPWPAPWRVLAEVRGYAVTAYEWKKLGAPDDVEWYNRFKKYFTGWEYYKMAWRWLPVRRALIARVAELRKADESVNG